MENENLDQTQQVTPDETAPVTLTETPPAVPPGEPPEALQDTNSTPEDDAPQKPVATVWWVLLAIVGLLGIGAVSAYLGYSGGIRQREDLEGTQVAVELEKQYELALADMETGRYENAQQRLEFIIDLNPVYPDAVLKLAEVRLSLNSTATPTPFIEPTLTPTPDTRADIELYAHAKDLVKNEEWTAAIEILETLRKKNPEFQAVDVDGMLYVSLRNRGVQKIGMGSLEGGIYDLTLAEAFGPLDTEADSWRVWAEYYIRGASFWDVDWGQAVYYFGQVAPMTPNLHDGTGWTAAQRYLEAVLKYAEVLEDQGQWCAAKDYFTLAFDLNGDPALQDVIKTVTKLCNKSGGDNGDSGDNGGDN